MTRCYQCQDISSYDTEPCPNDPPCKPYSICNFPVTKCDHKETALLLVQAEQAWVMKSEFIGVALVGGDYDEWDRLGEDVQERILKEAAVVFKMGYLSGHEDGREQS